MHGGTARFDGTVAELEELSRDDLPGHTRLERAYMHLLPEGEQHLWRGLWLHLRNSPILWAVPVRVVVDLATLFLRNRYWIGVWPDTGVAALVPAYLIGIVGAGAAAWAASAPETLRTH